MRLYTLLHKIISAVKTSKSDIATLKTYVPTATASYAKIGGLIINYGTGTITPSAANTDTTKTVTFAKAYTSAPIVVVGLGGQPAVDRLIMSVASRTTTNWVVHINATNATERRFYWVSIGI